MLLNTFFSVIDDEENDDEGSFIFLAKKLITG